MNNSGLILLVDDTLANLEVMSEALENAGYEVATAIDGERALKRVQTYPPDLILLDVKMPGMDGFEICRRLKSDPATANIPVIFMTVLTDTESKLKGFSVGAVDYITVPFQTEEVLARVSTQIKLYYLTQHLEKCVTQRTAALQTALEQLEQSQLQLIQSEKMSALGNLVAGIAHEINNPISCIVGNVSNAEYYIKSLLNLIDLYSQKLPQPDAEIEAELNAINLNYLRSDFPQLINAMKEGGDRIRFMSKSLRIFSRADSDYQQLFNIHDGIDSTVMILRHRLRGNDQRPEIKLITQYGNIPAIYCFPGQLNQVFMNILANAIDALDESNTGRSYDEIETNPNCITIRTSVENQQVKIAIADNGTGMPESVKARIFERSFTTKTVGKGTGLGLAIAHHIVVEKHRGSIEVDSTLGQGTTFTIWLPANG